MSSLPHVILLNGPSCAGKTSIAQALQQRFAEPVLRMGVDEFIPMLPARYLGHPEGVQFVPQPDGSVSVRLGPISMRVLEAFHSAVRAVVASGLRVIVDDVLLDERLLPHWVSVLQGCEVFFVAARCSLEELERRERGRPDRARGHARATHEVVHAHGDYDLVVDTTAASADACAQQIIAALERRSAPSAFERLAASGSVARVG